MSEQIQENQNEVQPQFQFNIPNHAQRRRMLRQQKVLRAKNEMNPMGKDAVYYREAQRENGRKIHESNLDRIESSNAAFIENKLELMKQGWSSQGYNSNEIEMLEKAWRITTFKNKATWHSDKKEARSLMKQADESRKQRNSQ